MRAIRLSFGPSGNWRRFCNLRLSYDIDEVGSPVCQSLLECWSDVFAVDDLPGLEPKPPCDCRVVDRIEIDREIPIVMIEVLQLFDPTEGSVAALNHHDR